MIRFKEALIRGAIWAFVGLLYGMLFVFFSAFAEHWSLPINPYLFAGVLSGTLGALIYSSMRLAVLMTIITSPLCIFYFILAGKPANLPVILMIATVVGAIVGALYGVFSMGSRVNRADAKTLTGFSAGWLVSLCFLLFSSFFEGVSIALIVSIMCPLTGILYVFLVPGFIKLYDNLLPPVGDGLMVGVGVSSFVTLSFFIMISSIDNEVAGSLVAVLQTIHEELPGAMLGGVIGGGSAGILSGILLTEWQDL
ncbi:MAG: hypothetical protein JAY99_06655 [Candidatus Thiodiazotropha lotti]|uniref:Uncharacterized protein n=1 Tax=Candidatus Thiodiazotropha endoloripes TaxID=1818881 RepID=A0A1E2URR2_9GAMM|nr:hypothetical protein [Candidatus Thiodiazotropha endoloripes]MCG7897712.1 hypothetical protein [Candidatus Thiodiazotropha weberae]MCG7990180.1 hypothetical protein [Candidatus Thiodiazotropha lotti]MCG7902150.1 hypothetical protein [Candidatus Thiodiazotropha weberae]MCG7913979.1 hypothetical protein [Candidatus Thiodiazotropha weberae]MCG7999184.1 hypothetical protein [Candidatus Thiodiazotropha lotti]